MTVDIATRNDLVELLEAVRRVEVTNKEILEKLEQIPHGGQSTAQLAFPEVSTKTTYRHRQPNHRWTDADNQWIADNLSWINADVVAKKFEVTISAAKTRLIKIRHKVEAAAEQSTVTAQ